MMPHFRRQKKGETDGLMALQCTCDFKVTSAVSLHAMVSRDNGASAPSNLRFKFSFSFQQDYCHLGLGSLFCMLIFASISTGLINSLAQIFW